MTDLHVKEILNDVFGHTEFREPQEQVINLIMAGQSLMLLLATGGGKSLCYQLPSILMPGMGLVISPLVSLMDDQVNTLIKKGVKVAALHSGKSEEEREKILRLVSRNELDILYVSPERLEGKSLRDIARRIPLSLVAIDECHVVSSWGHEFRPAYREIPRFLRFVPSSVPRIALTATADAITVADVRKSLGLENAPVIRTGFDRPNIFIGIRQVDFSDMEKNALEFIESRNNSSGVVYCTTQNHVEKWTKRLQVAGYNAVAYHAGLVSEQRQLAHAKFVQEHDCIVVATIAFGMGIDKPETAWVLHIGLPSSPEAWYQEIGRAGRNGQPAEVLMLWTEGDIVRKRILMERSVQNKKTTIKTPDFTVRWATPEDERSKEDHQRFARQRFEIMAAIARSAACRRRAILGYLDQDIGNDCGYCDRCLHSPPTLDATKAVYAILSLVETLSSPYGVFYLCEILLGSSSKRIQEKGHNILSEFGCLHSNFHRTEIAHYILQCAALNWLNMPPSGRGGFSLTMTGAEALADLRDGGTVKMTPPPIREHEDDMVLEKPEEIQNEKQKLKRNELFALLQMESKRLGISPEILMSDESLERLSKLEIIKHDNLSEAGVPAATIMLTGNTFLLDRKINIDNMGAIKPKFGLKRV